MAVVTPVAPATLGTRRRVGWARARRYVLPLVGLAVALAFLGPYLVMVLNSLRPSSDVVLTPPTFLPRTWQWSTFGDVLGDQRFLNWLKTSLLVATSSTIIVPWAASLVITAKLFTMIYDYYYGTLNLILSTLHITSGPIDFLGDDRWTMASMILVGIFVSVPFTSYVFVAGLSAIPTDVYEAAKIDGARPWQTYWRITLPLLRPAMVVASVLNIIYVFNSFPIVYTLNDRNPGFLHDTTITFMYKLAFKSAEKDVGMSAAAGIFNVVLILIVVVIYLRTLKWQEQED